jgi:hypothetical protein
MLSGSASPTTVLSHLIAQEEAACQSLLETVYDERLAIRALAVTEFHTINCRRLAILERLQQLADQRDAFVVELSQRYKLMPSAATLHGVIEALTGRDSGALGRQYEAFMATARTVREQIKHNVILIENIRGFIDKALSAGTAVIPGLDLYGQTGRNLTTHQQATLIRQQG